MYLHSVPILDWQSLLQNNFPLWENRLLLDILLAFFYNWRLGTPFFSFFISWFFTFWCLQNAEVCCWFVGRVTIILFYPFVCSCSCRISNFVVHLAWSFYTVYVTYSHQSVVYVDTTSSAFLCTQLYSLWYMEIGLAWKSSSQTFCSAVFWSELIPKLQIIGPHSKILIGHPQQPLKS